MRRNNRGQYRGRRRWHEAPKDNCMERLADELNIPYNSPVPDQDTDISYDNELILIHNDNFVCVLAGSVTIGVTVLSNMGVLI